MKNSSKVSIVIPCYNVEEYVVECLDSIIYQTYENLEIICVNDGSTDKTVEILETCRERDSRIIVISTKNQGQGAARNLGTKIATGKYIMYVDSDDWIKDTIIEDCVNEIVLSGANLVLFSGIPLSQDNSVSSKELAEMARFMSVPDVKLTLNYKIVKEYDIPKNPVCKLIDLEWMKSKDIKFSEGMIFEDIYFAWSLFFEEPYSVLLSKCGYYYRMRSNSTMTDSERNKSFDKAICHLKNWELLLDRVVHKSTLRKHHIALLELLGMYAWCTRRYSPISCRDTIISIENKLRNKLISLGYTINAEV